MSARYFTDPPSLAEQGEVDFDDPLERTAIALLALGHHTPEAVGGMLTSEHGRRELAYTWRKTEPARRHLHRRRAALLVDVAYHGLERPLAEADRPAA